MPKTSEDRDLGGGQGVCVGWAARKSVKRGGRANPLKIGPRTSPGVHPGQFFNPDGFPATPGPENGPQKPKPAKNRNRKNF